MRVLLTTDTIGGVWTFTRELTGQLLNRGHSVALVSFGRRPSPAQLRWCGLMAAAHPQTFLHEFSTAPLEWMQENQLTFAVGAKVIARVAARFQPDVLHANQFCWGALTLDIPKVVTAHSDVMSWAAAVKPEVLQGSEWLVRYRALVQAGLDAAGSVTAPTAWMRTALGANFHVPSRFDVIYNGVSIPRPTSDSGRELRAVCAGRLWDKAKGLHTLAAIHPPMPVVLAGEGSFEDASVSLSPAVSMLGLLSEEQLLRAFARSAVYIAASVYEPFGLAPLEAALCGCAVVARNLKSLREVWGDGALYFNSAPQLESLLLKLATDDARLRQAQAASGRRARLFTAERMASGYLDLYARGMPGRAVQATDSNIGEITAHVAQAKTGLPGAYAALGLE